MGCDYYIQKEFVIEYECKDGKINTIVTNKTTEKGYIFSFQNEDSDDDMETENNKFYAELERMIDENTYDKILFENDNWVKETYKKRYQDYLFKTFNQIYKLKKVYKSCYALKRD
jgi:predicted methyltransferase